MRSATATSVALVLGLAVTGCGGTDQAEPAVQSASATPVPTVVSTPTAAAPTSPSRAQVAWMAGSCSNADSLTSLQTGPSALTGGRGTAGLPPQAARDADLFGQLEVSAYLANAGDALRDLATRYARLPATGLPAADALSATQLRRLRAIAPAVFRLSPPKGRLSAAEQLRRARSIRTLFASVGPPAPALQNVVRRQPLLAAAQRSAPACK